MPAPNTEARPEWKETSAGEDAAGQRLDRWLSLRLGPDLSRNRVKAMIKAGNVRLNGKCAEPKRKLAAGDGVRWRAPEAEASEIRPQEIPLEALFEDEHLIVVNKPAGLVVHPGAGNADGTLVNALLRHCGDTLRGIGGVKRPGIVHRLDKETSGVMVVAKNDMAHKALSEAFAGHGRPGDMERIYRAIVWGSPNRKNGVIDAPVGRASADRTKRAVVPAGRADARHAITRFTVLNRFGRKPDATAAASLIQCRLETGRTHQIRVHMAHIGHPLIGDPVYGRGFRTKADILPEPAKSAARAIERQALHAATLSFRHPANGESMRFETPVPADMAELIDALEIPWISAF